MDYKPTDEELYRNNDIQITFRVPEPIQEVIDILDDLYEKEEDLKYNLYLNSLNSYCKSYHLAGLLSDYQFETLMDRYGAW